MKTENPKCWFKYTEVMSPACRFHVPSPVVWRLVGQLRLCKFKLVLKEWRKKEGILINKWHLGPFSFNHTMKKQEAQAVFWKYKSIYYKILKTLFLSSSISLSLSLRVHFQGTCTWFWCCVPLLCSSGLCQTSCSSSTRMSSKWRCRYDSYTACARLYRHVLLSSLCFAFNPLNMCF